MTAPGAHPRSRGENHARKVAKPGDKGSSPLTRGKRLFPHRYCERPGLIPAHAGKTVAGDRCFNCHGAHPRSRGENKVSSRASLRAEGSSPLTRGKLGGAVFHGVPRGLIPAHAGKTGST